MAALKTIAFDMIGTCFSLDRPQERLLALGAPKYALQLWFAQTLRDAFAWSHAGGYQPFKQLLEAELPRTLALLGIDTNAEARAHIVSAFGELELVPGALDVFQRLSKADWNVIALTNGSLGSTQKLLERSSARQYFTDVHSCDELEITKPHPQVYQLLPQTAGSVWMVAAHAWDIAGAIRAGLKTAFITTGEGEYLSTYPQPDILAPDLMGAVDQIIAKEKAISQ